MFRSCSFLILFLTTICLQAQNDYQWQGKFEQLGQELPTPNVYRAADGAPGPSYWQQQADYKIELTLDDERQSISGKEKVVYHNNSPMPLTYLWLQLDQNKRLENSDAHLTQGGSIADTLSAKALLSVTKYRTRDCGMNITSVTDKSNKKLKYTIQKTMMRIDLPKPLKPGKKFTFKISWWYNINDRMEEGGRSGFEYFPKDGNYLYTIAQFYPRMAVYDDVEGWQNKQFIGSGEFALTFGNYDVSISVPNDHMVTATGMLQNPKDVLTTQQYNRYKKATKTFDKITIIATQEEAIKREKSKSKKHVTWHFKAENVRDFAFANSRKLIWDAQAVRLGGKDILAQSLYPKEGNPLWELESTKAVVHTLNTYSKYTIDYPYPIATSVHGASIGMEYPMICFNFGRPNEDGSYTDAKKYGMIGVIIHEVGHNYFPMIINSDERQWTWLDEGLNTFIQYRTQVECYDNFPVRRGAATTIIPYMKGNIKNIRPIMTNSEQLIQFGNNAYAKPSTALNILRETVLGPKLFDKAFKTYAQRWAFKHPSPSDFFRTMEDASAVDLDWFWRGWFYTVDHVDIAIDTVQWLEMNKGNKVESTDTTYIPPMSQSELFTVTHTPDSQYGEYVDRIDEIGLVEEYKDKQFYQVNFSNIGGLVMPIIIEFELESGTKIRKNIPAEIWRKRENKASKLFIFDEKVIKVQLDPDLETADTDVENNVYPKEKVLSKFDQFKLNNQ